jgi:hypothetical protein
MPAAVAKIVPDAVVLLLIILFFSILAPENATNIPPPAISGNHVGNH